MGNPTLGLGIIKFLDISLQTPKSKKKVKVQLEYGNAHSPSTLVSYIQMEKFKLNMNVPEIFFVLKVFKCGKLLLFNILLQYENYESMMKTGLYLLRLEVINFKIVDGNFCFLIGHHASMYKIIHNYICIINTFVYFQFNQFRFCFVNLVKKALQDIGTF